MPDVMPMLATATNPPPENAVTMLIDSLLLPSLFGLTAASCPALAANVAGDEELIWHWQAHSHRQVSPPPKMLVVVEVAVVNAVIAVVVVTR